jgi:hypothetical protein
MGIVFIQFTKPVAQRAIGSSDVSHLFVGDGHGIEMRAKSAAPKPSFTSRGLGLSLNME